MTTALKPFQSEIVDAIAGCIIATVETMAAAPQDRSSLARRMGAVLLEAPTGSGKTLMLSQAVDRVSAAAPSPMVWLWITPYTGIVTQTEETLRQEAEALRLCALQTERTADLRRNGDVFVFTWGAVSTRNAGGRRARDEGELMPSIDVMLAELRDRGWYVGVVIDEAHTNLGQNAAQAMAFLTGAVRPDVALLATATPRDAALANFEQQMGIERVNRFTVARSDVVEARLNKKSVKAITFRPRDTDREFFDMDELAITHAVHRHEILKARLREREILITPLLLVQVESTEGSEKRAKEMLIAAGIPEAAIAIHTAKEPDPAIHTIAYDETKQALIFKLAVATGFDAPRAWALVSLRRARGADFGLQIIGRIMRVHRRLQPLLDPDPLLDCGYVFLSTPDLQVGLANAADRLQALRTEITTVTDEVNVLQIDGGAIAVTDQNGGFVEALEARDPSAPVGGLYRDVFQLMVQEGEDPDGRDEGGDNLAARRQAVALQMVAQRQLDFLGLPDQIDDDEAGGAPPSGVRGRRPSTPSGMLHAPLRSDIEFPRSFQTELMPSNTENLIERIAALIDFGDNVIALLQVEGGRVNVVSEEIFDHARETEEQRFSFSAERLQQVFRRLLRFNDSLDERALMRALVSRLERELVARDITPPEDKRTLRRTVMLALARKPRLLKEACGRALAQVVQLEQTSDIPETILVPEGQPSARKGLYERMPMAFDSGWEQKFARLLDEDESGVVVWWHRNLDRKPYSVAIVRPDGRRYFPDFIIGVNVTGDVREKLAEVKRDIGSIDSLDKHRSDHREYGQAVMVYWDDPDNVWFEVVRRGSSLSLGDLFSLDRLVSA
jgi:superfamily II DNA or RNA helicase